MKERQDGSRAPVTDDRPAAVAPALWSPIGATSEAKQEQHIAARAHALNTHVHILAAVAEVFLHAETDAVLVLEDYQLIDTPAIHQALAFLLDHLPPRLHLIMTTRADPPLPLPRLRAGGQLAELRAVDLRFTPAEAATFLTDVMGLPLSADDIVALETRTEGWIAGLQFAALAMRDRTCETAARSSGRPSSSELRASRSPQSSLLALPRDCTPRRPR